MSDWGTFLADLFRVLGEQAKPQGFVMLIRGDGTHDCPVCKCLRCAGENDGRTPHENGDPVDDETRVTT